jgi:predicted DNA-binding protein YlxM (UPF0122 family)
MSLDEIAKERELGKGTIIEHLQKIKDSGRTLSDFPHLSIDLDLLSRVRDAYDAIKSTNESIFDIKTLTTRQ